MSKGLMGVCFPGPFKLKKYLFRGKNERKTGEFRYSMTITIRPLVV